MTLTLGVNSELRRFVKEGNDCEEPGAVDADVKTEGPVVVAVLSAGIPISTLPGETLGKTSGDLGSPEESSDEGTSTTDSDDAEPEEECSNTAATADLRSRSTCLWYSRFAFVNALPVSLSVIGTLAVSNGFESSHSAKRPATESSHHPNPTFVIVPLLSKSSNGITSPGESKTSRAS